jgi:hydrogenase expression/formation protein HypC
VCLAVPGRILSIGTAAAAGADAAADGGLWREAQVDFGGVRQRVSLACLPEARVGDRVLVHVGIALSLVDDAEPCA